MIRWLDEGITNSRHESEQTLEDNDGKKSGMLHSMWSQRVRHDLATEQQQYKLESLEIIVKMLIFGLLLFFLAINCPFV